MKTARKYNLQKWGHMKLIRLLYLCFLNKEKKIKIITQNTKTNSQLQHTWLFVLRLLSQVKGQRECIAHNKGNLCLNFKYG